MCLTLSLLGLMAAAPAAAETLAPHAPVVTATALTPMNVADQIDHYLKTSPVAAREAEDIWLYSVRDDRRPHGEIAAGVGTRGYRSFYARTDIPLGETGRLSVAIGQSRFASGPGGWFDPPHRPLWAGARERQRCDLEGMTPERPSDRIGGPHGHCRDGLTR
ncbi:hypothetical protein [Phenylobacterium sp.]|uniref:hypothetical protein n=1 Tax=Phenylobacterium sp. TaxID=1871053 RepID=UPI0037CA9271